MAHLRGRAAIIATTLLIAGCIGQIPVTPPSPTPTASPTFAIQPSPTQSPPPTGGATFYFQPGPTRWCGVFSSYRAASATQTGELIIGAVTFLPAAEGFGAPYVQHISSDVHAGGWVCLAGTVVRSETAPNQLTDLTVQTAPLGSMPPGPINATPCGLITEVFVGDLPSGGFITLNGTKFLVGGARPASDVVKMTPSELRVGVSLCITGTRLTALDPATFTAVGGRAMVMR